MDTDLLLARAKNGLTEFLDALQERDDRDSPLVTGEGEPDRFQFLNHIHALLDQCRKDIVAAKVNDLEEALSHVLEARFAVEACLRSDSVAVETCISDLRSVLPKLRATRARLEGKLMLSARAHKSGAVPSVTPHPSWSAEAAAAVEAFISGVDDLNTKYLTSKTSPTDARAPLVASRAAIDAGVALARSGHALADILASADQAAIAARVQAVSDAAHGRRKNWPFVFAEQNAVVAELKVLMRRPASVAEQAASDVPGDTPKRARGKNIDARMLKAISEDQSRLSWSASKWAEHLGCSKGTVGGCNTWKNMIRAARALFAADKKTQARKRP